MEINLTLVAQIIHFFLAWLIIQKLLLEPALCAILKEQGEDRKKRNDIDTLEKECYQKDQYKKAQWKECQRLFAAGTPDGINKLHLLQVARVPDKRVSSCYETPINPEEVTKMAQAITKKIEHIDD